MTDFRYLLAIYVHAHETGNSVPPHIDSEARAALAEPEAPTDEELNDIYWQAAAAHPIRKNTAVHIAGLRAVLARWGK